jgi:hypothetical protein
MELLCFCQCILCGCVVSNMWWSELCCVTCVDGMSCVGCVVSNVLVDYTFRKERLGL